MTQTAQAQIETEKASRYLKALCNHFSRKTTAAFEDNHGSVEFSIGSCQLDATDHTLTLHAQAEDAEQLARVKTVMADHLVRFAGDDNLEVYWTDQA